MATTSPAYYLDPLRGVVHPGDVSESRPDGVAIRTGWGRPARLLRVALFSFSFAGVGCWVFVMVVPVVLGLMFGLGIPGVRTVQYRLTELWHHVPDLLLGSVLASMVALLLARGRGGWIDLMAILASVVTYGVCVLAPA